MLYAFRSEIKGCTFDIPLFSRQKELFDAWSEIMLLRMRTNKESLKRGQEAARTPQTFRSVKGINQGIIICHVSSVFAVKFLSQQNFFSSPSCGDLSSVSSSPCTFLPEMLAKMKLGGNRDWFRFHDRRKKVQIAAMVYGTTLNSKSPLPRRQSSNSAK